MAEEETETAEEVQGQTFNPEESKDRQIAALEKKLRASQREGAFLKLRTKHSHITDEDLDGLFKGVPTEKWEAIAERMTPPAPQATQEAAEAEKQPQIPAAEKAAIQGVTKPLETIGGNAKGTVVPATEALAKVKSGEWSEADWKVNAQRRSAGR